MSLFLFFCFLFFLIVIAILFYFNRGKKLLNKEISFYPFYYSKLMSNVEQQLYFRLIKEMPDFLVFSQVQASRILKVKKGNNFYEWHNKINRLSFDFVLCKKDSTPIFIIELDDSTHDRDSRKFTDFKKDKAVNDAGLIMVRWKVNCVPENIRSDLVSIYNDFKSKK